MIVCLAAVSLAMVAGFLSLLPGGVGVREYVVLTLLAPAVGTVAALVSAVLLRLCWLAAELVAAGVLYPLGAPTAAVAASAESGPAAPSIETPTTSPNPGAPT
jgi:hypothetical protein